MQGFLAIAGLYGYLSKGSVPSLGELRGDSSARTMQALRREIEIGARADTPFARIPVLR